MMDYLWVVFILVYYCLALVYLLFGVNNRKFIKCILKCLPVITLLFQVLVSLVQYARSTEAKLEEITTMKQLLWGIAFSAIGDGCLVFPKVFIVGIISFATSLCIYINLLDLKESITNIGIGGAIVGMCICALSLTIILAFMTQRGKVKTNRVSTSVLSVLLLGYFSILSTLLWSGISLFLRQQDLTGACSAAGVTFFYISDVLIAASAVLDFRILQGRALVMLTYYTAQLLLASSFYLRLLPSVQHYY